MGSAIGVTEWFVATTAGVDIFRMASRSSSRAARRQRWRIKPHRAVARERDSFTPRDCYAGFCFAILEGPSSNCTRTTGGPEGRRRKNAHFPWKNLRYPLREPEKNSSSHPHCTCRARRSPQILLRVQCCIVCMIMSYRICIPTDTDSQTVDCLRSLYCMAPCTCVVANKGCIPHGRRSRTCCPGWVNNLA